jgi:hypothetical protein
VDKEQIDQLIASARLHLKGAPTSARGKQNDAALIAAIVALGEMIQVVEGLAARVTALEAQLGDEANQ